MRKLLGILALLVLVACSSSQAAPPTNVSARVYNSANISIPAITLVYLTFDSERWDPTAMHSVTTNTDRITIATPGKYLVCGMVTFEATGLAWRETFFEVNGTTANEYGDVRTSDGLAISVDSHSNCTMIPMEEDDYVRLGVSHGESTAINVINSLKRSPEFSVVLIAQ